MSLREDLDNLLKSPGWLWLVNEAKSTWHDNLTSHLRQCAGEADDVAALNKLRQVIAAKDAVDRFVKVPEEKLKALQGQDALEAQFKRPVTATDFSRRGGF